jgi:hypothetical protein
LGLTVKGLRFRVKGSEPRVWGLGNGLVFPSPETPAPAAFQGFTMATLVSWVRVYGLGFGLKAG